MPYYKDTANRVYFLDYAEELPILQANASVPGPLTEVTKAAAEALNLPLNPKVIRKAEIKRALNELDLKKIRPLSEGDTVFLATLNEQTITLRSELASLGE